MTTGAPALEVRVPVFPRVAVRRGWRIHMLVRNPLVAGGLVLVVFFFGVAVFASVLAPADPIAMNSAKALEGHH